jgi:hypothetical protein
MINRLTQNEHRKGNKKTGLYLNIVKRGKPAWDSRLISYKVEDHRQCAVNSD